MQKARKESLNYERILITGISGSGGSYLAEYIANNFPNIEIHGISRWHSTATLDNLKAINSKIVLHECDLTDFSAVLNVLKISQPQVIFHLASHANVRSSFQTPISVIHNNISSTVNLFEAVRFLNMDPIIQLCSTSEVYGQVSEKDVPINELAVMNPSSPYAVSKATQDLLGFTYFTAYQMKVIRTRMFAYLNPRRVDLFATSFARQVARIEVGLQNELIHGNLNSVRTIIDVRDAMEAYWVAVNFCEFGEAYNIGGNVSIKVGDFLDILKSLATTAIPSRIDMSLLRPADVTLQIPSTKKFEQVTGWKPRYSFEESVSFLLNYWRKEVLIELREA